MKDKDKRNKESAQKLVPEPSRIFDRRAPKLLDEVADKSAGSSKTEARATPPNAPRRPLSSEAFHEILSRYCRRAQKDGREFCLASLSVLEYKTASEQEKEQLDKAVVNVLLKFLRSEDRISFIEPAHYLILTPYTSFDDANTAMKRVAERISNSKIRVKTKFIYPSAFVKVISSASRTTREGNETIVDCESIYNSLGYTIDGKGRLRCLEDDDESHMEPLFRGNLDGWLQRYKTDKHKVMHDLWNENAPVESRELKIFESEDIVNATINGALFGNLLRRLRALQNVDHPNISRLYDFYARRDGSMILITAPTDGIDLKDESTTKPKVDTETLVSWLNQILNALVFMQAMSPPAVPSSFENIQVFVCDRGSPSERIIVANYEPEYLMGAKLFSNDETPPPRNLMHGLFEFIVRLDASCRADSDDRRFTDFLRKLDDNSLSSPYKLRTQLKYFAENVHA